MHHQLGWSDFDRDVCPWRARTLVVPLGIIDSDVMLGSGVATGPFVAPIGVWHCCDRKTLCSMRDWAARRATESLA